MAIIKTSKSGSSHGVKSKAPSKKTNSLHRRHERLHVNKGITH